MAHFHIEINVPDEAAGEASLAIAEGQLLKTIAERTSESIGLGGVTARLLYDPTDGSWQRGVHPEALRPPPRWGSPK